MSFNLLKDYKQNKTDKENEVGFNVLENSNQIKDPNFSDKIHIL